MKSVCDRRRHGGKNEALFCGGSVVAVLRLLQWLRGDAFFPRGEKIFSGGQSRRTRTDGYRYEFLVLERG